MNKKHCIYCLPYAGSGASFYAGWQQLFKPWIDIVPIDLPGHEKKRKQPLCDDIHKIVHELADEIINDLEKRSLSEFSLFGYSMGGVIAYELSRELSNRSGNTRKPTILFMGASAVISDRRNKVSTLDDEKLKQYLSQIGGVTEKTFINAYADIIRNDYSLLEKYRFDFERTDTRIVAFASKMDRAMPYNNICLLQFLTDDFKLYEYSGNHFFIRDHLRNIVKVIKSEIFSSQMTSPNTTPLIRKEKI